MYYIFVFFFAIGVSRIFALANACLNRSGKTLNCLRPLQVQSCNKNRTKENWKVKRWSDKTYIQRTFFCICLFIGWMVTILMNHDCCSEKKLFCCWKWIPICPVHKVLRINLQFLCCVCVQKWVKYPPKSVW